MKDTSKCYMKKRVFVIFHIRILATFVSCTKSLIIIEVILPLIMAIAPVLSGDCPVCNQEAKSRCSACYVTFYCGSQHQKENWKEHKINCKKPYKVDIMVFTMNCIGYFVLFNVRNIDHYCTYKTPTSDKIST